MTLAQDLDNLKNYWNWEESGVPIQTVDTALRLKEIQAQATNDANSSQTVIYTNPNYSGAIATANSPQDIVTANPDRDRLTIQNLDDEEAMFVNIDDDAGDNNSFILEPGVPALLEEGEADKRVSVYSPKVGLKFAAIGRVKQ